MAVKSRESIDTGATCITTGTGNAPPILYRGPYDIPSSMERIASTERSNRSVMNPCSHTKFAADWCRSSYYWHDEVHQLWSYTAQDAALEFMWQHAKLLGYPYENPQTESWGWYLAGKKSFADANPWPPVFDWDQASARAYTAMVPSMSTDLNLSVALAEIHDVWRMFEVFDFRHGFMKRLSQYWKRFTKDFTLRDLADAKLQWEFGWKQTYRDLRGIISNVLNFSERLDDLLSRQNAPQRRHYAETPDGPTELYEQEHLISVSADPDYKRTCQMISATYNATMEYDYYLPSYSIYGLRTRAFLDAYGLNLNLSTIWELIPFSFVVDWFVGIGNFLQSNEDYWLEPTLQIRQFCHSLKFVYSRKVESRLRQDPWVTVVTTDETEYHRSLGIPNMGPVDLREGSGLQQSRVVIGASLLSARSRPPRRSFRA